nr:MAG TPA: hypothetical protein [Caudoviricetes sp.]
MYSLGFNSPTKKRITIYLCEFIWYQQIRDRIYERVL